MRNKELLTLVAALIWIAAPAAAESVWVTQPGGTQPCSFASFLSMCFSDFDADENSPLLNTSMCENWSVRFNSDVEATTYDTTINVRCSLGTTVSANTSEIVNNATLTGDPSTGLDVLAGYDCPLIYIDVASYSSGDDARVSVQCFKRAAK